MDVELNYGDIGATMHCSEDIAACTLCLLCLIVTSLAVVAIMAIIKKG